MGRSQLRELILLPVAFFPLSSSRVVARCPLLSRCVGSSVVLRHDLISRNDLEADSEPPEPHLGTFSGILFDHFSDQVCF